VIFPFPVNLRLPPWIKNTFSGAVILFPFKLILTVFLISRVLSRDILFVKSITSVLLAALIASSNVSKKWFPILALAVSLALTLIGINNIDTSIKYLKNNFLI